MLKSEETTIYHVGDFTVAPIPSGWLVVNTKTDESHYFKWFCKDGKANGGLNIRHFYRKLFKLLVDSGRDENAAHALVDELERKTQERAYVFVRFEDDHNDRQSVRIGPLRWVELCGTELRVTRLGDDDCETLAFVDGGSWKYDDKVWTDVVVFAVKGDGNG